MPKVTYDPLNVLPAEPTRLDILRFFQSAESAADYFGVGSSAVRQWSSTRSIPAVHVMKMRLENPEFFEKSVDKDATSLL